MRRSGGNWSCSDDADEQERVGSEPDCDESGKDSPKPHRRRAVIKEGI